MRLNRLCHFLNTHHESIPILSTGYSLIKIFSKAMLSPKEEFFKKHHFTSLKEGCLLRDLFLLVPFFGNGTILFYDHKKNCELEYALDCVKTDELSLYYALEENKSNKAVVDAAIEKNSASFRFAADLLRNDPLYIEEKMQKDTSILRYAGDKIKSSGAFFLKMMPLYGACLLSYASNSLLENETFMAKAIKISPEALKYAKTLRKNESFVFQQTLLNDSCLRYASKTIRKNRSFLEKLVKEPTFADKEIMRDHEFATHCFKADPKFLSYFCNSLKNDPAFILLLSEIDPIAITFAFRALQENKTFVLALIEKNPKVMQFSILNDDEFFLLTAININPSVIQYAHLSIRKSWLFFEKAMRINREVLKYAFDCDLTNNVDFFWEVIQKDAHLFKYAGTILRSDLEFLRKYIYQDCTFTSSTPVEKIRERAVILNHADDSVKSNAHFLNQLRAYGVNPLPYAHENLKTNLTFTQNAFPKSLKESYYKHFDFNSIHESFKDHDAFISFAAKLTDQILKWASPRLQDCKEMAVKIIERRAYYHGLVNSYEKIHEFDRAILAEYMKETTSPLAYMGDNLKNDYSIVLECTYYDKDALDHASPELQKDERLTKDRRLHGKGSDVRFFGNAVTRVVSTISNLWK